MNSYVNFTVNIILSFHHDNGYFTVIICLAVAYLIVYKTCFYILFQLYLLL